MAKAYYFNYIPVSDASQCSEDEAARICTQMIQIVIAVFQEYGLYVKDNNYFSCRQGKKLLSDEKCFCCVYPDKLGVAWDHSTWDYSKDKSGEIFVVFKKDNRIVVSFGANKIAKESTNEEIISRIRDKASDAGVLPEKSTIFETEERIVEKPKSNTKVLPDKLPEVVREATGFKEDLEREKKLELESSKRYEYYEGIFKQIPYFNDMLLDKSMGKPDYETAYKRTLQPAIQPACQKVINDSISFWGNWKSLPTLAEKKDVIWSIPTGSDMMGRATGGLTCKSTEVKNELTKRKTWLGEGTVRIGYYDIYSYRTRNNSRLAKYRWPDGSIHCDFCVLDNCVNIDTYHKFGLLSISMSAILKKEKLFLQEVQEKLDRYNNNMREGSQEYVQLCYYEYSLGDSSHAYYDLFIFRDGTVYYDIPDYHVPEKAFPLDNSAKIYDFLLKKMKQGPEKYMSYQ